jgi:hypothetical protein
LSRNDDVQATALPQGDCWQGSGRQNQSHGSCAQPESLGQEGWPLASDLASSWVEFAPAVHNATASMEKNSSSGRQGGVVVVLLHVHTHGWFRRLQAKDTYLARPAKPTSVGVNVSNMRTWSTACGRQQ